MKHALIAALLLTAACTPSKDGRPSWGDMSTWNWEGGAAVLGAGLSNAYQPVVLPPQPIYAPITCQTFGTITRCR